MEKVAKIIQQHQKFLITTHSQPDGDGLGSEMALHWYLKKIGKKSVVMNTHPTPAKFHLVDPHEEIQVYRPLVRLPQVDCVFVMDTNELKMLGALEEPLRKMGVPTIFIDHHVPDLENLSEHLIDEAYGSTGELVYSFLRYLRAEVDAEMALAIYVAIVTDTGSFRFKRTTANSHRIAAELLQKGVLPEQVFSQIYARDSFAKVRLFGHVLEHVQKSDDGRIAWIIVPKELRERYQATVEDTESYVNSLSYLQGVDIGILFREEDDGRVKISLRGSSEVPVVGIAKKFGGGGHRHAAGAKLNQSLSEGVKAIVAEAQQLIADYPLKRR